MVRGFVVRPAFQRGNTKWQPNPDIQALINLRYDGIGSAGLRYLRRPYLRLSVLKFYLRCPDGQTPHAAHGRLLSNSKLRWMVAFSICRSIPKSTKVTGINAESSATRIKYSIIESLLRDDFFLLRTPFSLWWVRVSHPFSSLEFEIAAIAHTHVLYARSATMYNIFA